jgi:hypothetical protein
MSGELMISILIFLKPPSVVYYQLINRKESVMMLLLIGSKNTDSKLSPEGILLLLIHLRLLSIKYNISENSIKIYHPLILVLINSALNIDRWDCL